ncbi:hemicentin-1-like isoform X1 [Silurus meridionalis]|uniref:hemicentin-1-like isoform X1 n=1 Tax=Silurus meridionalis TaxID=175797 RepID=UPI001EEBCAB4|nr:hemicentin-1-like isoform X1 [Silurus meridionalis]
MQTIFGILMMFIGAASGLLFQDPVVYKFNKSDQCYVALGERLHLQIPPAYAFNLNIRDKISGNCIIIRFRKNNPLYLENHTRWQFVKENNTMILTSAERSDSGTYILDTSDAGGALTGSYTLQLHTEAQVSSVSVWYKCLASEDIKVHCSAEGDDLTYSWTSDFNTLSQLENGTSTLTLNKGHHGNVTCYVKNHVSQSHNTTVLQPCPGLLFQDPVVCKFNKNDQCYVALGERLHLQIPPADWFNLNMRDMTSADRTIIRFRNNNLVYLENHTRWQFVKENNTMILTSAERSDSGTYSLDTSDAGGALTGRYTLQLHTEAQVSSVSVWYKCLASEDIKVHCSAEGDNLTYSWTSDFNTLSLLENGTSTHTLNKGHHGNVTCYVKNHVSQSHNSTVLQPCPGLLFQDPVVYKFNKSDQCYVALGERLHLQIPPAYAFNLLMRNKTSTIRTIIRFRKNIPDTSKPNFPRWQFVKENNTMILTSAERSDSGTYSLDAIDAGGALTGSYTLQLHTEAQVSSVSVWYKCLASEDIKVHCSAEGDNLTYSWTSDFNTLSLLENGISTLTLNKGHHGNITCYVKNHVSQSHNSTVLQPCPEPTTTPTISVSTSSNFTSFGTIPSVVNKTINPTPQYTFPEFLQYTVIFLSVFCVLIILIFIVVFYVYRKNKGKKSEAAPPQGDRELVYTEVNHKRQNRSEPTAGTSHVQDDNVEYAAVAIEGSKRKTKKNEDEVQYGELVFNTPAKNKSKGPKVQDDDCVYSQVHHSR